MEYNEYIALAKPNEAARLCSEYGIDVDANNPEDISDGLSAIVLQNGKSGLKDVMEIHPDRKVIVELSQKATKRIFNATGDDDDEDNVDCSNCIRGYKRMSVGRRYNATGDSTGTDNSATAITNQTSVLMQQNTFIILAAVVITAVLLVKK